MSLLKKTIDFLWPMCPSGMDHRIRLCVVQNDQGHFYCWHQDCMKENTLVTQLKIDEEEEHQRRLERIKIAQEVWEKFIEEQRPFLQEHLK